MQAYQVPTSLSEKTRQEGKKEYKLDSSLPRFQSKQNMPVDLLFWSSPNYEMVIDFYVINKHAAIYSHETEISQLA